MNTVYISIGSNIGNRAYHLYLARTYLKKIIHNPICSTVMDTSPLHNIHQNRFLNQIIKGQTTIPVFDFLQKIKEFEKAIGRIPNMQKNQPRIIDIDILDYNGIAFETDKLTLPHPFIAKRPFILEGIAEIDPSWEHKGENVSQWLKKI